MSQSSPTVLLDLETVLKRRGCSKSQHYIDVNEGVMVPPVAVSERSRRYPQHELEVIQSAKVAGATKDELKALVKELVKGRRQRFLALCSDLQVPSILTNESLEV